MDGPPPDAPHQLAGRVLDCVCQASRRRCQTIARQRQERHFRPATHAGAQCRPTVVRQRRADDQDAHIGIGLTRHGRDARGRQGNCIVVDEHRGDRRRIGPVAEIIGRRDTRAAFRLAKPDPVQKRIYAGFDDIGIAQQIDLGREILRRIAVLPPSDSHVVNERILTQRFDIRIAVEVPGSVKIRADCLQDRARPSDEQFVQCIFADAAEQIMQEGHLPRHGDFGMRSDVSGRVKRWGGIAGVRSAGGDVLGQRQSTIACVAFARSVVIHAEHAFQDRLLVDTQAFPRIQYGRRCFAARPTLDDAVKHPVPEGI
jgi:hypothetical protein